MSFNNSQFDPYMDMRFFEDRAEWVQFYAARKCSCSDEKDPNRANPSCLVCSGSGTFYADPVWLNAVISNISNSKMLVDTGIAMPGDLVLTSRMMESYLLADQDIIKLDWDGGEAYDGELVMRSANDIDKLIYDAMEIDAVTQSDPDLGTVASFVEGTDFTHSTNSDTIEWIAVNQPARGSVYSVRYRPQFSWICFIPPAERRERGTNLGQRVVLKRKHLVLAKG